MFEPKAYIKSNSTKFLLIGYILLIVLFSVLLVLDSQIQKGQINVINSSVKSTTKMKTIVDLIETARKRVALSHDMISADDIFDKDEISLTISELGMDFIRSYSALLQSPLTPEEKKAFASLDPKFEEVRQKLRQVATLALEDNPVSDERARNIILNEIVPLQQVIIDKFMQILSDIQNLIHDSRTLALDNYANNKHYRNLLIVLMLFASMIVIIWVIKRLTSIEGKLNSLSLIDGLTNIANRRSFDKHLSMVWGNCMREAKPISLLLIDIDYFKKYNDFYGHQQGDKCLVIVAEIIQSIAKRTSDLAARYGGEEFAIILPNDNKNDAYKLATKLISMINNENIAHEKSDVANHVTISVGISTIIPLQDTSYLELIKMADKGLYESKENGRNQATYH